jgi:hypothetical protein
MPVFKGVVKNNTVVLEEGAHLPEGAEVEVRVVERPLSREEAFQRILANQIHRYVGMDQIIEEDKREREERADQWFH